VPAKASPRVGLNLTFFGERAGGIGRYALELPGALLEADPSTDIRIFISRPAPQELMSTPWASEVRWVHCPVKRGNPRAHLAFQFTVLPLIAAAHRVDVLHSVANVGPAIAFGMATVVSLHDAIWTRPPQEWGGAQRWQHTMGRLVAHELRHADQIFADSQTAAEEIVGSLCGPAERVHVTPLGVRRPTTPPALARDLREQLALGESRILLSVAQKQPYKNLHRLIRALPDLDGDVKIVLPGSHTQHEDDLRTLAAELGVLERVCFPDWLSQEQLEGLFAISSAVVLPSLIEGFGLPALEAMVRGVPVVCSRTSALGEVAGDAALLFDPERQDEVTSAIRRVLDDRGLAKRLVERGYERAAQFNWKRTGLASLEGYKRAVARSAGSPSFTHV
jgi:glycosyltransferase involved in cell wall biosynthesis